MKSSITTIACALLMSVIGGIYPNFTFAKNHTGNTATARADDGALEAIVLGQNRAISEPIQEPLQSLNNSTAPISEILQEFGAAQSAKDTRGSNCTRCTTTTHLQCAIGES